MSHSRNDADTSEGVLEDEQNPSFLKAEPSPSLLSTAYHSTVPESPSKVT